MGCIFDGSGYGEDGNIWGGEFILYSKQKFKRVRHFDYFHLPGGDICTKEVWRTAVSLLHKYDLLDNIPLHLKRFAYKTVTKMIESDINSPLTSSIGRIFDAVAALTGIKNISTFEAEAAIALESAADERIKDKCYSYKFNGNTIDISLTIKGILEDIKRRVPYAVISAGFHNTVADIIFSTVKEYNIKKIVLSGGVFQNIYLLDLVKKRLFLSGFNIYCNAQVPLNDGGICLGQAYINNLLLKNK